jgi:hypothetical protein
MHQSISLPPVAFWAAVRLTMLSHYEHSSLLSAGIRLVEHSSTLQTNLKSEAPEAFFGDDVFEALE